MGKEDQIIQEAVAATVTPTVDSAPKDKEAETHSSPKREEWDKLSDDEKWIRYGLSGKEGNRLNGLTEKLTAKVEALESFKADMDKWTPVIEAYKRDPELIEHTLKYYDGNNIHPAPGESTDSYSPDETILDKDNIVTIVEQTMERKLNDYNKGQQVKDNFDFQKRNFLRENPNVTEADLNRAIEEAKQKQYTIDDIWLLTNKDNIIRETATKAATTARDAFLEKAKANKDFPRSLATVSETKGEPSEADRILDRLKQTTNSMDILSEAKPI